MPTKWLAMVAFGRHRAVENRPSIGYAVGQFLSQNDAVNSIRVTELRAKTASRGLWAFRLRQAGQTFRS